ncbi:unnamed protein product [Parascedosporium putredinis]|uniref:glycerophosphodiester phosphodiesterase n=1 Tax=Parascedosporium putredinis TaxID=1442378 RepID=A0A9P1GUB9_9PEZI|nr:unnamed protein product [Parascedosporium putredinis]CAI7987525.1 unnamed protein product [Parascedosporium putredinis]
MHMKFAALALGLGVASAAPANKTSACKPSTGAIKYAQLGPRPFFLVDDMEESDLKDQLTTCMRTKSSYKPSAWSVAHRGGGTLMIPEHSLESNMAGARMGAGILECDVAFTKDRQLVCRHSQCDLATTTNIVSIPELNAKCTKPFTPASGTTAASAKCCTSDLTLAEFKTLCAKIDGSNPKATTAEEFLDGTPAHSTDLYATCGTLLTHKEHIELTNSLGLSFTPELKTPEVKMPFEGDYTQEQYAQQLIDEYKAAGIDPSRPEFGKQAVFLDSEGETPATLPVATEKLTQRAADGVRIVAPPLQYLVTLDENKNIIPSAYAKKANELGLDIITWSLERSGFLGDGSHGGYYYSTIADAINTDGDVYKLLHVLAQDVKVRGVFSDWSATVTFYANCFGVF